MLNASVLMPMGIYQLTSVLESKGMPVTACLDFQVTRPKQARRELQKIIDSKPGLIGLSSNSHGLPMLHSLADFFKRELPGCAVVAGGPIGSANPDGVMENPNVDFVVMGEGEESLPALIEALEGARNFAAIPNLVWRDAGEVIKNKRRILTIPLDDIPFPAWDRMDFAWYAKFLSMCFQRKPYAAITTSRGCPFHCIYCHNIFGKKFRARSVDNVLEELHLLYHKYGIRHIEIIDDIFNLDLDRAKAILTRMRDELPGMAPGFGNGVRFDMLDEQFMQLLRDVGCFFLGVPFESISPRMQKVIGKNLNLEKAKEALAWTAKYKIYTIGYFMLGFPTETCDEMEATIRFAKESTIDLLALVTANPYEGTKMAEMMDAGQDAANLGNNFCNFLPSDDAVNELHFAKYDAMKSRMLKPSNLFLIWNMSIWKLWWLGPVEVITHLARSVYEIVSGKKGQTIELFENERNDIREKIQSSLK